MKQTKQSSKLLALFLVLLLALSVGCSAKDDTPAVSVTVNITGPDQEAIVADTIDCTGTSAGDAFKQACKEATITYTVEEGMYDNFKSIASTDTDGWIFFINGEVAQVGADDYTLQEGDKIEFQYVNYDEVFGS